MRGWATMLHAHSALAVARAFVPLLGRRPCCRVALLGCGTVGGALAADSRGRHPGLALTHVFDRRADAKRRLAARAPPDPSDVAWTDASSDILTGDADSSSSFWVGSSRRTGGFARRSSRASRS